MKALKKNWRLILTLVLAAVFVVSLFVILKKQLDYWDGANEYAEAEQAAGLTLPAATAAPAAASEAQPAEPVQQEEEETDPIVAALKEIDLDALRQTNPDILGWILIPDTEISYPLLQGGDNSYYLDHTWKGEENSVGAIFLDYRVNGDFSDFNTVIYGHRMRNGSMFAGLKYYTDQSYYEQHPSVYIALSSGVYRYDIFAAYEASVGSSVFSRSYENDSTRTSLLEAAIKASAIDAGLAPTAEDKIITLSTCTGRGYSTRWVVHAVLAE